MTADETGSGCPFAPAAAQGTSGQGTSGQGTSGQDASGQGTGRKGGLSRRGLFGAGLAAAATAPVLLARSQDAGTQDAPDEAERHDFHGEHQAGILTPLQRAAAYVSFDVTAQGRSELVEALRTLTATARFLTRGGTPPDDGLLGTAWDNGVLGPEVPADGLTVTVSVGASLFDDRFGLAEQKPARLRQMEEFPNDALDRGICDGDILVQLCAHHPDTVNHALRQLMRTTRGVLQIRWRQDGFASPSRPSGTPRDLLGFKDGISQPATSDRREMDRLVWTRPGGDEPEWVAGGTYHVVRIIRMFVEFWDRVSVREQQTMIGRVKSTGAPLSGSEEFDEPSFAGDGTGEVIRFDAHIRLANPRTEDTADQRILRRSYNYDNGTDPDGQLQMGHLFTAFNQDLDRQFVTIQKRLADEPLVDYVSPVGGGYFFALPGVRDEDDWYGSALLS